MSEWRPREVQQFVRVQRTGWENRQGLGPMLWHFLGTFHTAFSGCAHSWCTVGDSCSVPGGRVWMPCVKCGAAGGLGSPGVTVVKNLPAVQETLEMRV